jgi:hypothetical protein
MPMAIRLLRLLSFLNPDGILIQFLEAGAEGLRLDLRTLISHRLNLQKL